jgi:Glycosyltransferase family 87
VNTAAPIASSHRPGSDGSGADRGTPRSREGVVGRAARLIAGAIPTRSRADTVGWFVAWFCLVAIGLQIVATVIDNISHDLWPAYDTYAYWLAARHVVNGQTLYEPALIWTMGAFKYPPVFAQVVFPLAFLPELPVDWAWRIVGLLCLRYMCDSWKLTVLAILQWPVFAELNFGNVTLALGAVALWSFRDSRAIYLLPWFAGMKFGPALLLPYFWFTRPQTRGPIIAGCAVFALACLASFAVAPGLWWDYLGTFGWESSSQMQAMFVYAIVPNHGGLDFAVRLGIAAVAILIAIRWRLDWLAFIAATATMPIFSLTRLAVLVALWPLWLRGVVDRWRRSDGPLQRWLTAPLVHLDMLPALPDGREAGAG